jgi:hypothetical protein
VKNRDSLVQSCRCCNLERRLRGHLYYAAEQLPFGVYQCLELVCLGEEAAAGRTILSTAPVFRPEALRRYAERAPEPSFPMSVAPRAFLLLWVLLATLVVTGAVALCLPVPVYVGGVAALTVSKMDGQSRPLIAVFMPADQLPRLRIGQRVLIRRTSGGPRETGRIASIYPGILTKQQIENLVDHTASAALTLAGSKAVALAELDPASTIVRAGGNFPGCCEALVEVGSWRVISLLGSGQAAN